MLITRDICGRFRLLFSEQVLGIFFNNLLYTLNKHNFVYQCVEKNAIHTYVTFMNYLGQ